MEVFPRRVSTIHLYLTEIEFSQKRPSNGGGGQQERKTLKLADVLTDDNRSKALAIRGLPFRVKMDEVKEFF